MDKVQLICAGLSVCPHRLYRLCERGMLESNAATEYQIKMSHARLVSAISIHGARTVIRVPHAPNVLINDP